jgi:ABC-type transporter Mla subunit MlaD
MKKLFLGLSLLITAACTNPSMERGFGNLNSSLDELQVSIDNLDINGLNAQMAAITQDLADAEADINAYVVSVEEYIAAVAELQAKFDAMAVQVQGLIEVVDGMIVAAEGLATTAQFQALIDDMNEFQAGIDILVGSADYDSDGVSNALDKCPDTELGIAVDADGCSADQL